MSDSRKVIIYTDGACSGNPGPGGWAALLVFDGNEKELSGYEENTTNNRMEMTAVIRGLDALKERCTVEIHSDSAYIVNCFKQGWLNSWKRHGWQRGPKKNQPVLNVDLWKEMDQLVGRHEVSFHKVKGHSGHPENERVDQMAVAEIEARR